MEQCVLITGATGGIGKALCKSFKKAGYYIIATDILQDFTGADAYYSMDLVEFVANETQKKSFLKFIKKSSKGKKLTTLINNAAVQILGGVSDITVSDFRKTLEVNVMAPFLLMQSLLPMLEESKGSVINIGSIHSRATKPKFLAYATSKTALKGLTQAASVDLGGHVRVNNIQPAATATEMLMEGFKDEDKLDELKKYHPIGRIAEPLEIADIAVFLASDKASFITGVSLNADGGIGVRLYDPE